MTAAACLSLLVATAPAGTSWLERAAPFLIGIFILLVSVPATHQVVKQASENVLKRWTQEQLHAQEPEQSPETQVLSFPWVVDSAQIPAILGTPLAGLFIIDHANFYNFIILYTGVLTGGLLLFFYFLQKVPVDDYGAFGKRVLGYRVSPMIICGIGLNLLCAVLAAWVFT